MGGNRLRQLRCNTGLSIAEFAKKAGVSVGHIYRIEQGAAGKLRPTTITKIARALEVGEDEIFPLSLIKRQMAAAPSGCSWNVTLTCPKCQTRFRLVVQEGHSEEGQGGISCPICGFVQSISLRRAS